MTDFPQGNGHPDCPDCGGRGVVPIEKDGTLGLATQNCRCVYLTDLMANLDRIWRGLAKAPRIETSPLMRKWEVKGEVKTMADIDLWVTATTRDLRAHLRHLALRKGPKWQALVTSDSDLASAWLATKAEVYDPDVTATRAHRVTEHYTIVDLAVPPKLLIIRLGVKAAKNREMPGVLLEAIHERHHRSKPTWVVDTPANPFGPNHICFDSRTWEYVSEWETLALSDSIDEASASVTSYFQPKMISAPLRPARRPPPLQSEPDVGTPPKKTLVATREDKDRKSRKKKKGGWR